jgi:predicted Zn-dependent protease
MPPGRLLLFLLALPLLSGCANNPPAARETVWIPTDAWWANAVVSGGTLTAPDGRSRNIKALHARNLNEVAARLRVQSAVPVRLALADGDELNAYAGTGEAGRVVTLTIALLEAIGSDRDALATTLGHEIAHLYYAHGEARKQRNPAQGFTYVFGSIAGLDGMVGTFGALTINTTFTRYEEREADLKGIEWAVEAGFSPCGSARTMRILATAERAESASTLLSTHPGHEERVARAHAMSKKLTGSACLIL